MSEPKGTLDTSVNGPEDPPGVFDGDAWQQVDWRMHEERVRRLRRRIFKAVRDGDLAKARNLQKLMLRNWSNTLVSVRQVTQRNAGRATAGIDGRVALTARARAEVAVQVHATRSSWRPVAVKRVYIPKAHDKTRKRPLGIPVIMDRCHQARVRQALEPEWEARFEARSYGFRPGRGCHDAIESLFNTLAGRGTRVWILDADLAGAFNAIDHDRLLAALGMFPARGMIAGWLKAGVVEAGVGFTPTTQGVPQGGVISPLILNIALHGLEEAAGVRYRGGVHADDVVPGSPAVTRYADSPGRLLPDQAAGRAGQGVAGRVAGAEGPCVQPGQDPDRAPHRGPGLPGCDTRSHGTSERADWRADDDGSVAPGKCSQVRPRPDVRCW